MTTPTSDTAAQRISENDRPLGYTNCHLVWELAMERFEQILKEGKAAHILAVVQRYNEGPFALKGPFTPVFSAHFFSRLPHRWAQGNAAITDEVMHAALNGFIESFSERWWKEWLDAALHLLNGAHGWNSRAKGEVVTSCSQDVKSYQKEEEMYALRFKELYQKVFGLILSHLDHPWLAHDEHVADYIAILTHYFIVYSEWNEDPTEYGITEKVIPIIRKSHYTDEMDLRRIELGKFTSRIQYLEWRVESAEWPFRDEDKEGKKGMYYFKPSELKGDTLADVHARLIKRRETTRKELEDARELERVEKLVLKLAIRQ